MQIQIHAQNDNIISHPIRYFTHKKLEKLQKHHPKMTKVRISLSIENLQHTAKATLHIPGCALHAQASAENDMYQAIDQLIKKLDQQLQHKKKTSHTSRNP